MLARCNKHIKKFNQLVDVYEPDGIERIELVNSRERDALQGRKEELADRRARVQALGVMEFFDDGREQEIRDSESHPDPSAVAESQRDEMLDRLDSIEGALTETIEGGPGLETGDGLDW